MNVHNLQQNFLTFELRQQLKSLYSHCGTVTETWFEYITHLLHNVSESVTKLNANAFFSHYKIADCT
jgi:hypothetical protein